MVEGSDFLKLLNLVEVGKMALVHEEYRTLPVTVSVNQTCQYQKCSAVTVFLFSELLHQKQNEVQ